MSGERSQVGGLKRKVALFLNLVTTLQFQSFMSFSKPQRDEGVIQKFIKSNLVQFHVSLRSLVSS